MHLRPFLSLAVACACAAATLFAQAPTAAERQREDLRIAREAYVLKTRAMTPAARERARALLDDAAEHAGALIKDEFHLRLLEVVALADNGHDVLTFARESARPDVRMPYRVTWFPDGVVLMRTLGDLWDLAGARIEAIDGLPVEVVYERLARYAGGVESQRKLALSLLLESPGLLHAAGLAELPDRLTLDLKLPGNRMVHRTIRAVSNGGIPRGFGPERLLSPEPAGTSERNWTPAISRDAAPLAFLDGNRYFRTAPLLSGAALYVQFRINFTYGGQDIDEFQSKVLAAIAADHPKDLVLDLRFDTGGDLQSTLPFMRALPSRVPGRVYVLISRYTFSAGIVSAAAVKKAGGARTVIVGEAPGDRLRFWSEGDTACLPESGFCLRYTDGLFDLAKGCAGEAGCYGDEFDVNVGSLAPEIAAPLMASDYLAGTDRAMDAVLARLR